jgi:hypothetical protein
LATIKPVLQINTNTNGIDATHALSGAEALVAELATWVISLSVWCAATARSGTVNCRHRAGATVQEDGTGKARWKIRSI